MRMMSQIKRVTKIYGDVFVLETFLLLLIIGLCLNYCVHGYDMTQRRIPSCPCVDYSCVLN